MCLRRLIRRLRKLVPGDKCGAGFSTSFSLAEVIGKSVHISLTHLHYDGRLAARYELYGHITRIDDSGIIVRLSGSEEECRLRRDPRIFNRSGDADFDVRVGSIGVPYRNDLTRCVYPAVAGSEGRR